MPNVTNTGLIVHDDKTCCIASTSRHPLATIRDGAFAGWMMPDFIIEADATSWVAVGRDTYALVGESHSGRRRWFAQIGSPATFIYRDGEASLVTVEGIEIVTGLGDTRSGPSISGFGLDHALANLRNDLKPCDIILMHGATYERDGDGLYRCIETGEFMSERDAVAADAIRVYRDGETSWRDYHRVVTGIGDVPAMHVRRAVVHLFADLDEPHDASQHAVIALLDAHADVDGRCARCDTTWPCSVVATIEAALEANVPLPMGA